VVAEDARDERGSDDAERERYVREDPPRELRACQKMLLVMLVRASTSAARRDR
jgi:hypothetical protein